MHSLDDEKCEQCKEEYLNGVIKSDLYNGDGVREYITQEMCVEEISYEKYNMSFRCYFCVFSDEWISKVWIFFGEQKKPSEEEVGDRGIVSYFLRNHIK